MTEAPLRAVLTGDLVHSRSHPASDRDRLATRMKAAYRCVQQRFSAAVPHPLAIFRGDSWQMYVADSTLALEVGLLFRAALRTETSLDTRTALAIDTVDTVNEANVSESTGPAFQRSGRALDVLQDDGRMRCLLPETAGDMAQLAADALCDLADHLATHWTDAQAQAVALRLMLTTSEGAPSQAEIARHWQPEPITQQAVSKHLRQASWARLDVTLDRFERLVRYTHSPSMSA